MHIFLRAPLLSRGRSSSRRSNSQEPTVSPKKKAKSITDLGQASQPDNDKKAEEDEKHWLFHKDGFLAKSQDNLNFCKVDNKSSAIRGL